MLLEKAFCLTPPPPVCALIHTLSAFDFIENNTFLTKHIYHLPQNNMQCKHNQHLTGGGVSCKDT